MARRAESGQANARRRSRGALALFFIAAGSNHFASPGAYRQIVPPSLQREAKLIVEVSGVAEIAGGLAVLLPGARRAAGVSSRRTCTWRAPPSASGGSRAGLCTLACRCSR